MRYIFVDNFRGFKETLLPIIDVNFFVGENSSGKTSILGLTKLLSSPEFWFTQKFDTEEVELGNFPDIVSINSPDRRYFRIGLVDIIPKEKGNENDACEGLLITLREKDGVPIISRYTSMKGGTQVHIKFGTQTVKYKHEDIKKISIDSDSIKRMLMSWSHSHDTDNRGFITVKEKDIPSARKESLFFLFMALERIISKQRRDSREREIFFPISSSATVWLAPIRTKPQRTYDKYNVSFSPEGEHTPYLIKKLLASEKGAEKFLQFIRQFGQASGLFESISVKKYGRSTTAPFELDVTLDREALKIGNVGYGVSQSLPIIVELFARPEKTWFAIQQPEIHLHPRAQVALGDIFFELAMMESKKFIVETHTDFIVDGFRLNYRKEGIAHKPNAQIVFFESTPEGNVLHPIGILENGELSDKQPPAYRDFFVREQMRLLGF